MVLPQVDLKYFEYIMHKPAQWRQPWPQDFGDMTKRLGLRLYSVSVTKTMTSLWAWIGVNEIAAGLFAMFFHLTASALRKNSWRQNGI